MVDGVVRLLFGEQYQILENLIVEDPISSSDYCAASASDIPRKPDTWLELLVTGGCLLQLISVTSNRLGSLVVQLTE